MITKRVFLAEAAAASLLPAMSSFMASPAQAADYPDGPVKIIVAQSAGGSLDVILRLVAEHLSRTWGKQVVVMNVPTGGSGVVAARNTASAAPDGYTLFMASASIFTVLPEVQPNLPFDVGDFVPIGFTGEQSMAIVVSPTLGVSSLPELIALSKKQPGGLNCAVGGRGSLAHLTGELFRIRSGASLTFVYYPGTSQSLNDVISGRVPILINILPAMTGAISSNQVKLLSITSPARLSGFPDVPATAEVVPGFAVSGWTALVAPRGTPVAIVEKVNADLRAAQARPELKQRLEELGTHIRPMSPQQVAEFIHGERDLWRPVLKEIGIKPE